MKVYPFLSTYGLNLFEGLYISNLLSQILDFIIRYYYYYYYYYYYIIIIIIIIISKGVKDRDLEIEKGQAGLP